MASVWRGRQLGGTMLERLRLGCGWRLLLVYSNLALLCDEGLRFLVAHRIICPSSQITILYPVSYTHLRAHETPEHLVCRLLLEKKKNRVTSKLLTVRLNRNNWLTYGTTSRK
eukprot:TRINITY_DN18433_c0_g1_i1.p1 TRINITY_DN18433_c0_g1~~TRINITY_DN18433_c0_g1_i1.p1  ORF type:complete len:113 (-),score=10.50 TRINITY_DN18433_c0_g1_i1:35-373(-)